MTKHLWDFKKVSSYLNHDQNKKHLIFSAFSVLGMIKVKRHTITSQLLAILYLTNIGPRKKYENFWLPAFVAWILWSHAEKVQFIAGSGPTLGVKYRIMPNTLTYSKIFL